MICVSGLLQTTILGSSPQLHIKIPLDLYKLSLLFDVRGMLDLFLVDVALKKFDLNRGILSQGSHNKERLDTDKYSITHFL